MAQLAALSRSSLLISGVCKLDLELDCRTSRLTAHVLRGNNSALGVAPFNVSSWKFYPERASKDFTCLVPGKETTKAIRDTGYSDADVQDEELESPSVWDSNAENIRTNRSSNSEKRYFRERDSGPIADNSTEKWQWWNSNYKEGSSREWDYDFEGDYDREWDYDFEGDYDTGKSQWWRDLFNGATYRSDDDEDEEEDESTMPFSWFNFDIKRAFSMLSWMFPPSVILLPWLFGNPMFLVMAFFVFPIAQKSIGPLLPDIWRFFLKNVSSMFKSNQKRSGMGSSGQRKAGPSFMQPNSSFMQFDTAQRNKTWREKGQTSSKFSPLAGVDDLQGNNLVNVRGIMSSKQERQYRNLRLGGWEQLEESRQNPATLIQGRRKEGMKKRLRRKEVPLFLRLVIALFPFLRSWGGFL